MIVGFIIGFAVCLVACVVWYWQHQRLLQDRSEIMLEAIRNRDFMFRLPLKGLFFGEKTMQETLNQLGAMIQTQLNQNEVESWERITRVLTHEIMNSAAPIASISDTFMRRKDVEGTPLYDGIRAIHETSSGLISFVEGFRKFSALQDPEPVDVLVEPFLKQFPALYPDVEVHIKVNTPNLIIHTDENLLRQVIINMIKNAIEAGAQRIGLKAVRQSETDVFLKVSNDGAPIPLEVAREIFVPFFTTKRTGNGIGLSLSRRVMIKQGGSLELQEHAESGYHATFVLGFTTATSRRKSHHLTIMLPFLFLGCTLSLQAQSVNSQLTERLEQAENFRQNAQYIKALQAYSDVLKIDSLHDEALHKRVRCLMSLGNYQQGIAECKRLIERDTTDVAAWRMQGICQYRLQEDGFAFVALSKAYELDPDDYGTIEALSSLLNKAKEYDECIRITDQYRLKDTLNLVINQNAAEAFFRQERFKPALERYNQLVRMGDHSYYTHYFRGMTFFGLDRYFEAYSDLNRALKIDPENTNLLYYTALAGAKTSWKKEAVEYIEEARDLVIPNDSTLNWLYNGMATVYNAVPDQDDAYEQTMLKMYELNPTRIRIFSTLCGHFSYSQPEKALAYAKKFVGMVPESLKNNPNELTRSERATAYSYQQMVYFIDHYDELLETLKNQKESERRRREEWERRRREREFWEQK